MKHEPTRTPLNPKIFPPYKNGVGPYYWRDEESGILKGAIEAYLDNRLHKTAISPADCDLVRAYLCHWILAPVWDTNPYADSKPVLQKLREDVGHLTDADSIARWIMDALDAGIDPL